MKRLKIQGIVVIGRKWRDMVNGNTYHSAEVILFTSKEVHTYRSCLTYGYGSQYQETALGLLIEYGWFKKSECKYENGNKKTLWRVLQDAGIGNWIDREFYVKKKEL